MAKKTKSDVGFAVAGSLMNIIIGGQMASSKGEYALEQSKKLEELYNYNKKELKETYEQNWYKNNFAFIDQKTKVINQAIQVESDFLGQIGMVAGAYNISGSSYVNDTKQELKNDLSSNISTLDFNKQQQDESNVEQYNQSTYKLAESLASQNEALSDNYKQVLEQNKANTFSQLAGAGKAVGEYYVDNYYKDKSITKNEVDKYKIK